MAEFARSLAVAVAAEFGDEMLWNGLGSPQDEHHTSVIAAAS